MSLLKNPLFADESCRYCLENGSLIEPLYNMCNCKGSIGWYHKNCVKESWRYKKSKDRFICEICMTNFEGKFIKLKEL